MTQAIHMVARLRRSFSNRRLYLSSEVALILGGHRFAREGTNRDEGLFISASQFRRVSDYHISLNEICEILTRCVWTPSMSLAQHVTQEEGFDYQLPTDHDNQNGHSSEL
ncbi:hypothetical protein V2G26_009287 [Clonostachys chloroleuca]